MADMTTADAPHTSVSAGAALLGRELTPRERAQFEHGQKRARQALWALMLAVPVAVVGIAYAAQAPQVVTREWTYRTGVVRVRAEYTGGVRNGHYQAFHQNGVVSTEGQFDFGEPVGVWHSYDWNGVEIATRALGAGDGESEGAPSDTASGWVEDDNEPSAAIEAREGAGEGGVAPTGQASPDDAAANRDGTPSDGDAPEGDAPEGDEALGPGGLSLVEPLVKHQRALVALFCGKTRASFDPAACARTLTQVAALERG